jgi:predicted ATPase
MGMHTLLFQVRRDVEAALDWAQQTGTYAAEHGFPYWSSLSSIVQAWGIAERGDLEQGIAQFRRGLQNYLATGARLGLSWFLALLAQMLARNGQIDEAFETLTQAAAHEDATDERYYACEVHRLKGELLLLGGDATAHAQAEACFQEALATARRQHARSWELRAATSLARRWCEEGRSGEARAVLDGVCVTFTELGEDADLRDARRLLDELVSHA